MTLVKCDAESCEWNRGRQCMRGQVNMAAVEFVLFGGRKQVEVQCNDYEEEGEK